MLFFEIQQFEFRFRVIVLKSRVIMMTSVEPRSWQIVMSLEQICLKCNNDCIVASKTETEEYFEANI